jgi:predicted dehydrogenase
MTGDVRLALAGDIRTVPPALLHSIAAENIRFEALCDPDGPRAETAARTCGARWPFTDLEQMLREAEPDAVILAAPITERPRCTKLCLRHHCAVLILGAPGTTVAECRALVRASRQANRQVMIGLPQRFSPAVLRARRILESARLGPVVAVDLTVTWPREAGSDDQTGLPLSFNLMFEAADRLRGCGIEPARICAVERPYGHVAALIVGTDGVLASLALHQAGTPCAAGSHLELRSEDGGLMILEDDVNLDCTAGSQLVARHRPRFGAGDDPRIECGYAGMIAAFTTAVRERQGVPYGLPSATGSVAMAEAIFRAGRTGRPISLKPAG